MNEPRPKKSNCPYCGDADVNHLASFIEGCLSSAADWAASVTGYRFPSFFERLADKFPEIIFSFLSFIKVARFSGDINKVASYRSRIVWEEANRRNIKIEQAIIGNYPLEFYRAHLNGRWFYFQSLPIPPRFLNNSDRWDDKILLKHALEEAGIPTPRFTGLSIFSRRSRRLTSGQIFEKLGTPLVVKPRDGSRGRHTTTNIQTAEDLITAINRAKKISPRLAIEEHLDGDVCRATVINNVLAGLYRASPPSIVGDGLKKITELIEEKNAHRHKRVEPIVVSKEIKEHIARSGYLLDDILPKGLRLYLTHRIGRFYGGETEEMIDKLHPSFIPILKRAANVLNITVAGFDCVIPDPTQDAVSQRWGIIECNTLPFIDLHYFALKGKPRNIAGMIWDLWKI